MLKPKLTFGKQKKKMKKKIKWVCELPLEIQAEIQNEIYDLFIEIGIDNLEESVERAMNEKLINIIGSEYGLLPYEKYAKYIFEGVDI